MANTFTPEQIAQILEEFFKTVGTRQYIGARYLPIFGRKDEESIVWDNSAPYESLTVVLYQGNSFTSRQYVPAGVDITNEEFWAETGNYNAQIEQYRQETARALQIAEAARDSAESAQGDIDTLLPKSEFSAEITVHDFVGQSIEAASETLEAYVNAKLDNAYAGASYSVMFDGYDTDISCYVTILALPKASYAMREFIEYTSMQRATNYKEVFEQYSNAVFCAPNLRADYLIRNGFSTGQQADEPWCILCVDEDGSYSVVETYGTMPNPEPLIASGVKQALFVWEPLVMGGISYPASRVPSTMQSKEYIIESTHPRFIIGWDDDNTYLVAVSGSIPFSEGITHEQMVQLVQKYRIPNAINCDGGGSTQLWICPSAYNLLYTRSATTAQQSVPNNSRAKPMTGFTAIGA